ncbi:MAG: glycosyl hydrolase [Prolixibacteraceae bacterium]
MKHTLALIIAFVFLFGCRPQPDTSLREDFLHSPESAKPWVFWYWMRAAVTEEGITHDLEAMAEEGIGGAYLMPIKGADQPPLIDEPAIQLTPQWWKMVRHAFSEADRLGLKLAMHASDGFALAGGPWITPELSMQKVVWADTTVSGGGALDCTLPQPVMLENYYRDIAVYAYPTPEDAQFSTKYIHPKITSSTGENVDYLIDENSPEKFRSDDPCWIQYEFQAPFVCRSIKVDTGGNNFQAQRMKLEVSNDGKTFTSIGRLQTPRHGWQDTDEIYTYAIPRQEARFFRFIFDPQGTEPGAEDLDAAKWKANFKVATIALSGQALIGGIEGKNGSVWRIAEETSDEVISQNDCINHDQLINISDFFDDGHLNWTVPEGRWTILRMGHTSTGHTNYTGGGGLGLEVDKFNADAVNFQYEQWFGQIIDSMGTDLASRVLDVFHVDSWECGSQNWSPVFAQEFEKRRGYSLLEKLPILSGLPVKSVDDSEQFLKDIRTTIVELTIDHFYKVLADRVHNDGCLFSAECVAPTMTSDGLLHYKSIDIPMGEFWLRSPTHDKPNDALDALSGAHIYGKPIIQAEAFTELRMAWDEHPALLKTLGDRNFALGFNKLVFHVMAHNPWPERKPGMTLDPIGLFFQANQTWWEPGKAWVEYIQRCQTMLQKGSPVVDVAVFTGEEIPRRSVLPDRLVPVLPGIFGQEVIDAEKIRLNNEGQPRTEMPRSVFGSSNIAKPEDWVDPLNGYAYDSFNPDALLNLAKVKNGRIVLPGGASYKVLIVPGQRRMDPNGNQMSTAVANKLLQLANDGANIIIAQQPQGSTKEASEAISLLTGQHKKGKVMLGAYSESSFRSLGIDEDFMAFDGNKNRIKGLAWNHRHSDKFDIYFIANQKDTILDLTASFRVAGKLPEIYHTQTGKITDARAWKVENKRTEVPLKLEANESVFVIFEKATNAKESNSGLNWTAKRVAQKLDENWKLQFDPEYGGPKEALRINQLKSWTEFEEFGVKHYSGTVAYQKTFQWSPKDAQQVWIELTKVANIASVIVNGVECGVAWTAPYQVEMTNALKEGENSLEIKVTNTWANRLIGDHGLAEDKRVVWTTAPYMLEGKPLLKAGILGDVNILVEVK